MTKLVFYGTVIQCFMLSVLLAADIHAQQKSIDDIYLDINLKNSSIKHALKVIEKETGLYFAYSDSSIDKNVKIDYASSKASLRDVLSHLSKSSDLQFKRVNETINISKKFSNAETVIEVISPAGQTREITGRVTSQEDEEGLPGVNVVVKGSAQGTVTDVNGNYRLEVPVENSLLVFSSVGFISEEIVVGNQSVIDIVLMPDITALEEIVVIGYGTVKKSDLTGSVSSVSTKDMNPGPVANVSSLMQGTVSGVVLSPGSAQPGGDFNIRIRGTTSQLASNNPLYVVDGFPMDQGSSDPGTNSFRSSPRKNPLNSINPNDIVSIEILKDASATAIYGSRGANGVVLITTRQGKIGAMKVGYNASYSVQKAMNLYEMANGEEWADFYNNYIDYRNSISDPAYHFSADNKLSPEYIENIPNNGAGTDWQDVILRDMGTIQNHLLTTNGGNEKVQYYTSLGYYTNKGLVENTRMDRYSTKVNLTATPTEKLRLGINFNGSVVNDDQIHFEGNHEFEGVFIARDWNPTFPVYKEDGSFFVHPIRPDVPNPASLLTITDKLRTERILLNAWTQYDITDYLDLKIEAGVDRESAVRSGYNPKSTVYGANVGGEATKGYTHRSSEVINALFNYENELRNYGSFTTLLGFSYQNFDAEGFGAKHQNFATEVFLYNNLAAGADNLPSYSFKNNHKLVSGFIRSNLNLSDKYLFTFTARADGSSRFGANNKWAFFPSGAVAWKIHNEDFLADNEVLTRLKLRSSYGLSGNQEIGNYKSLALLGPGITAIGEQSAAGIGPLSPSNDELRWETSKQFEIGLDFGLWHDKVSGSINYYHIVTSDLLANYTIPQATGFSSITVNAGETQNKGFEFELRSHNLNGALKWETAFNMSFNKNSWKDRANLPFGIEDEFGPVGATYGYIVEGVFKSQEEVDNSLQPNSIPGQWKFKDINGRDENGELTGKPDGKIDTDDRTLLGYWQPDWSAGMNNIFTYKNLQLNIFLQGMFGQKRFGAYALPTIGDVIVESRSNILKEYLSLIDENGEFDYDNPEMLSNGTGNPYANGGGTNNVTFEDASFVRLRNVTLSYNFNDPFNGAIGNLRIYGDVQNLLTFTKFSGLDPEVPGDYPSAKTFTIGLNVEF
ncbi:MAG: TonB-dependent receptor [Cytophagales bacterium]|nr:TonB-dependent receptor [Cytophagales bacterium]